MMRLRYCLLAPLFVIVVSCGEKKEAVVPSSGGQTPSASGPVDHRADRQLDPLTAVFEDCSLTECQSVAAALVQGLADKRYSQTQVRERLAFLGTKEIETLRKLAPGLLPAAGDETVAKPELARIRELGLASDQKSLAELQKLATTDSGDRQHSLVATAGLARRGDKAALASLENSDDVESLTLWLDVVREKGIPKIAEMFLGQDPVEFERALQLVEQLEERAFEGMVDASGLDIAATLNPKLLGIQMDLARLTAIMTSVPGCRSADLARLVLDHPGFAELLRVVEERGRLMELLALLEIVDGTALSARMREASEQGDPASRGFWLARRLDLGEPEVVDIWRESLEGGSPATFFPGFVALARTKAPGIDEFLQQRLRMPDLTPRQESDLYQGLAVYQGLPPELGFPAEDDLAALGKKRTAPILEQIKQGRAQEALLTFLDVWDFKTRPQLELFYLGKVESAAVKKKVRALAADHKLGLRVELLGALAASGDEAARAQHTGFLETGILGFRERVSAASLTLGADIKTLPFFLADTRGYRVLPEKLMMEVLPLFGLVIDDRTLPRRRLIRYERSGGRFSYSAIAGGLILGPETTQ